MMNPLFESRCYGVPRPQGSLTAFINKRTGKTNYVYPKTMITWRESCIAAFKATASKMEDFETIDFAVHVEMVFNFQRPQKHYKSSKELRDDAPTFHIQVPDSDKLARAVNDSITYAGIWTDDCLVASLEAKKVYVSNPADMGVQVRIYAL